MFAAIHDTFCEPADVITTREVPTPTPAAG